MMDMMMRSLVFLISFTFLIPNSQAHTKDIAPEEFAAAGDCEGNLQEYDRYIMAATKICSGLVSPGGCLLNYISAARKVIGKTNRDRKQKIKDICDDLTRSKKAPHIPPSNLNPFNPVIYRCITETIKNMDDNADLMVGIKNCGDYSHLFPITQAKTKCLLDFMEAPQVNSAAQP
jgi:hypothetical protein